MFAVNNITTYHSLVCPPNGTRTGVVPHPSLGGNKYAPEFRDQVISIWQNGGDLRSPVLEQLCQQRKFPHIVTSLLTRAILVASVRLGIESPSKRSMGRIW
jgi:hypothetical protein